MKLPAYNLSEKFISIYFNGKNVIINSDDIRFEKVKAAIKDKDWTLLDKIITIPKYIAKYTQGLVSVYENEIYYNGVICHNAVTKKILQFAKENYPFEYLVKFLHKLMLNPSSESREQLYSYIELYKFPITENGDFLAMKAVRPDYLDLYSGKISNKPGLSVIIDRDKCDSNSDLGCSYGLHAGNIDYIKSYGKSNDRVILVEINPKDVVSCPKDSSYQKLRVCAYNIIEDLGRVAEVTPFVKEAVETNSNKNPEKEQVLDLKQEEMVDVVSADKAYKLSKLGYDIYYYLMNGKKHSIPNKSRAIYRKTASGNQLFAQKQKN
jgi:hypothetical protein